MPAASSDPQEQILSLVGGDPIPPPKGQDAALDKVEKWWRSQKTAAALVGETVRQTFDQVLDPERTGRYDLSVLNGVEQEYLAVRFRIILRDEFNLPRGPGTSHLSLGIEGEGVEALFGQAGGRVVPSVAVGELCLVVTASDDQAIFSLGILRVSDELIQSHPATSGQSLTDAALAQVRWIWRNQSMPENILTTLSPVDVQAIFAMSGRGNGQARIDELFRRVQGRIIPRRLTITVAHQDDPMKRARTARTNLQPEGIVILGHQKDHPRICGALGMAVPKKGELIAARVVRATMERQIGRSFVNISGANWVIAEPTEPDEAGPEHY
jgi:hypothetical protein